MLDRSDRDATHPGAARHSGPAARPHGTAEAAGPRRRRRLFPSPSLTRRILAINLLVLAVPLGGFAFLGEYRAGLIEAELEALRVQGRIFAGAVAGGAVFTAPGFGQRVDPRVGGQILLRLVEPMGMRARLFDPEGELIADTRLLAAPRGIVRIEELPAPDAGERGLLDSVAGAIDDVLPGGPDLPPYVESRPSSISDYPEAVAALEGLIASVARRNHGSIVLSVAVPVQRYRQVVGALMLTSGGEGIERAMHAVRLDILRISAVALAVTILLSLYLAATIARPLQRLAAAAERVRRGFGQGVEIPDFTHRNDEVGELSRDLRAMTSALRARMDAIERFAADVAHEIKNPLTSLRSAVETVARVDDPAQQRQLMRIIVDDVGRLDRLISDISDASRLDAELAREQAEKVDIARLLATLIEVFEATLPAGAARLDLDLPTGAAPGALAVQAIEERIGQVFRNVIVNALSFSPPGGVITVVARRATGGDGRDAVRVTIDDEGPGMPEANLDSIFRRFYSDRPTSGPGADGGRFGTHSGLGLSISRQIVEAFGGTVRAENRRHPDGRIAGARFVVELPAA